MEETGSHVTLIDATNQPRSLPRAQIASIEPSNISIMPAGLDQALTRSELADLIAYLRSLK
jgi:hypothetical protein